MNFLQLQDFLAVVEHQSITAAAQALSVTQQTLSGHMAALEKELGCQLFLRRPKFRLTDAGQRLYRYARQLEDTRLAMEQEFRDLRAEKRGILRLGAGNIRGRAWMPSLIAAYQTRFPQMEIHVAECSNTLLQQRLFSGELDVILANLPEAAPELCIETLYTEEMLLLLSPLGLTEAQRERVQAGDLGVLSGRRFLMNTQQDIAGRIGRQFLRQEGITPRIEVVADSTEILLSLCLKGEGACFCPDYMARSVLTGAQLQRLICIPTGIRYPISLAWQRGQYIPQRIAAFRDICFSLRDTVLKSGGR